MNKSNENGRSMIEMLGVLAIIGVLSVGGIAGYSKAMEKFKINKTIQQITEIAANVQTLYMQQKDFNGLDNTTAVQMGVVPDDLKTSANSYGLTYITNAFSHAKRLSEKGFHVILIGGELKGSTEAIVGAEAVLNIQKYHFSKGFFGTNGIDQKMAFTTPDINEALVKQVAMRNTQAENRYVLTTSDKFDKIYAVTFSGFEGSVILTEKMPGESFWKNINIQCV